ncbi:hypothetical protein C3Y98_02875 [Methylotenera oryzisoli]|uniref:Adhesin n=1 Tax=Methylotenera oryzisoli TaxID=2080758 RepID=A0A4Y9VTX5_9PROT|nr:hypothetical protein [Methylotenera oryzisoli]TFW72567.1 hypothetical protein C3Y98_02875 [Methylotenera oryzisoli]
MNSKILVIVLIIPLSGLHSPFAMAQDNLPDIPGYVTQSIIDSNVLSHVRGRFAVNMTAGDANTQANAAAIALGTQDGPAIGLINGMQVTNSQQANLPDIAIATIGSQAFAYSSGLISVNQSSGVGNAQANGAAFAMGFEEVVAESVLSATTSNAVPIDAENSKRHQTVSIDDTAFHGAHGLVQVNQSAGSGNSTANNFALQVQLGAKP